MKKIEMIWREILFGAIEKKNFQFTQKELARDLGVSTSTIFQALKVPRRMGAVRVTGRFFVLADVEKLLYHWANVRNLEKDVMLRSHVDLPVLEIEGMIPAGLTFGLYSACRQLLPQVPADYDTVYVYAKDILPIKERFGLDKAGRARPKRANLVILKADPMLGRYGSVTTLAQTFVDLWNLADWQAKDFTKALGEKIDGLLFES